MADNSQLSPHSLRQQRMGGDFNEFKETFKMSGKRPKEDVQRDMIMIDDLLADQKQDQKQSKGT